jgi:hypothetical protein
MFFSPPKKPRPPPRPTQSALGLLQLLYPEDYMFRLQIKDIEKKTPTPEVPPDFPEQLPPTPIETPPEYPSEQPDQPSEIPPETPTEIPPESRSAVQVSSHDPTIFEEIPLDSRGPTPPQSRQAATDNISISSSPVLVEMPAVQEIAAEVYIPTFAQRLNSAAAEVGNAAVNAIKSLPFRFPGY